MLKLFPDLELHLDHIRNLVDGEVLDGLIPANDLQTEQELLEAAEKLDRPEDLCTLYDHLAVCKVQALMDYLFLDENNPNAVTPAIPDENGVGSALAYQQIPHQLVTLNVMNDQEQVQPKQYICIDEGTIVTAVDGGENDDTVNLLFVSKL